MRDMRIVRVFRAFGVASLSLKTGSPFRALLQKPHPQGFAWCRRNSLFIVHPKRAG
jgi:hypothetical protein